LLGTLIAADQALAEEHDAQLVQIEGRLIAHDRASLDPTIVVSSGKFNFPVVLPKSADAQTILKLEEGSQLRITGICSIQADARVFTRHDGYPVARYFQVLLRSPSDVVVLKRPSWWSAKHTLYVLAFALAITLAILCWVVLLRIRVEEQTKLLRHQATHDGLTGLWNRKALLDLLQREVEIAARTSGKIGVIMLDADHFKKVNDTCGHLAGDAVLRELASRIQQTLRSYDLTGRYGGEEFLVVLRGCTTDQVDACAERIRAIVANSPIEAEGSNLHVTVSVGTAILDPMVHTQKEALATADGALYQAKHSGRNRVVSGAKPTDTPDTAGSRSKSSLVRER
jgi:diguanylate cyclase (GGDEF)-like protein